ncbi:MAG: tetratricopeptide repeat protein [Pseudomonadota bacterium]
MRLKVADLSFDTFEALINASPEPVSVPQLSETVWRGVHVSDETIAQRIALLRKSLGDDPRQPNYIKTVRGSGYSLAGSVTQHQSSESQSSSLFRRPIIGLSAAAAACLAILGAGFHLSSKPEKGAYQSSAVAKTETDVLVERARLQMSLHQADETDRAIQLLRTALEKEPANKAARLALSFALSTQATKFQGDLPEEREAEALARALIAEDSTNSDAWSALGYSLSAQGRSDEALAAYRQAFEIDPLNAPAMSSAAHLLLLRGDLQQSLLLDADARALGNPSRYSEIQIAQTLELIGHPSAQAWWNKALTLNPGQAVVTKEIANSLIRRGRPTDALTLIQNYEGEDGSSPQLLVTQSRALIMLDRIDEAKDILSNAGWRGRYHLAALSAQEGDPSLANQWFSDDIRLEFSGDTDPDLIVQLAEVSAALGNDDEAFELLSRAVGLGWRDVPWLRMSPFLGDVLSSDLGTQLIARINRELDAQRYLIQNTQALQSLL